jgi:thioredoxin 1
MNKRLTITGFILAMSVLYLVFLLTLAKPPEPTRRLIVKSDIFTEGGYLKSPIPVALHFYADWCRSCREEAPAVDAATREWDGKLKFIKVNVDLDDWSLAGAFGIHSIPSIVMLNPYSKAIVVHRGLLDAYELHEFIVNSLNLPATE